jgi:hypothetical protein
MIDVYGNRTEVYHFVREANQYLKKAGNELLGWDNIHVARYEGGKMIAGGSSPMISPLGEHADLVIGTYRKDNRYRVVISNSRCDKPASFSIKPTSKWKICGILSSIATTSSKDEASVTKWNLEPGGSVIIELDTLRHK